MRNIISISLILGLLLNALPVHAHHSFSATYTTDTITVEGYVEQLKFKNPHVAVVFNVTDDSGATTEWVTEGLAATSLRRMGWSNKTLKKGDYIRVTGSTTRNGSPMVSMGTLYIVDPSTGAVLSQPGSGESTEYETADASKTSTPLTLASGLPNLSGAWVMGGRKRPAAGEDDSAGGPPSMGAPTGARSLTGRGPGGPAIAAPYNATGQALQDVYDPANDPQVQCEPPGLVRQAGFTPHPVKIEQFDDHVVISYEEYGGVRTIYFDDRDLVGGENSHLGQSTARYEGQKLIVETSHLLGNLTNPGGDALSDQTTTVETYYRNQDADGQSSLAMDLVITDPGHLTEPWTMSWEKFYSDGYEFIEVACEKPL